jgi:hypothetical protein
MNDEHWVLFLAKRREERDAELKKIEEVIPLNWESMSMFLHKEKIFSCIRNRQRLENRDGSSRYPERCSSFPFTLAGPLPRGAHVQGILIFLETPPRLFAPTLAMEDFFRPDTGDSFPFIIGGGIPRKILTTIRVELPLAPVERRERGQAKGESRRRQKEMRVVRRSIAAVGKPTKSESAKHNKKSGMAHKMQIKY